MMAAAARIGLAVVGALAVVGCSSNVDYTASPPDGGSGAPGSCATSLTATQDGGSVVVAGPTRTMTVAAVVTAPGVLSYSWNVLFDGAVAPFHPILGDAAITVDVSNAGIYQVSLQVTGSSATCPPAQLTVNAVAAGAQSGTALLRVLAPRATGVPPFEQLFPILGGAPADLGDIRIGSGTVLQALVLGPGQPLAAYLQFSLAGLSPMTVEAFSTSAGVASVQLILGTSYSVLVVPSSNSVAPQRFAMWVPSAALELDGGTPITGAVLSPGSQPLAGATVQLTGDQGVPSTLATTAADGSFALSASFDGSSSVVVVPPPASGLPRLSAQLSLDPSAPLQIRYADNIATVALDGAVIRRLGAALPGARLTLTGPLGAVGTATSGSRSAVATGDARIAAVADASGALPATRAPVGQISAVVDLGSGDLAVVKLDLRSGAPASIDAPPPQLVTTALLDSEGDPLPGAVLVLVPGDALAVAQAPILQFAASDSGTVAAMVPAGGQYELRFRDPQLRAGPMISPVQPITGLASSYLLPRALQLQGTLRLDGLSALSGASVQVICTSCSGADRDLPLDEVVADDAGRFTVAVPDPGTR